MVKFLIARPVAVIMTFLALLLLGIVASNKLPVSLMPDIDIPEITVAVSRPDVSARELENTVVSSCAAIFCRYRDSIRLNPNHVTEVH